MKRIFLLLFCVLLCACAKAPEAPDLAACDFTADVAFSLGDREYAANYTKSGDTKTVVFTAPETISGMTAMQGADGTLTVTVGDLVYAASAADGMLAFTKLWDVPADILRLDSETDGIRCFTGSDGSNRYTVYTDPNGLPLRLCGSVDGREYDMQILRYERSEGR